MNIQQLHLQAFGAFTDHLLDFSDTSKLQIIYGPNEAGKSTTLRAIQSLFYGIPARTSDAFLHEYSKLRIGATLQNEHAETLSMVRRKSTKTPLLTPDGDALDPQVLASYLHGITENTFSQMFGIDYRMLAEGNESLLQSQGLTGENLFSMSLGGQRLQQVLQMFQEESEQLFKSKGKNPKINQGITDYKDLQQQIQNASYSSREWSEHQKAIDLATEQQQTLQQQKDACATHLQYLARLHKAIPLFQEWKHAVEQLKAFEDTPSLPKDFSERSRIIQKEWQESQLALKSCETSLKSTQLKLSSLKIPHALLHEEKTISLLLELRGSELKAQADLPKLQAEQQSLQLQYDAQNSSDDSAQLDLQALKRQWQQLQTALSLETQWQEAQHEVTAIEQSLEEHALKLFGKSRSHRFSSINPPQLQWMDGMEQQRTECQQMLRQHETQIRQHEQNLAHLQQQLQQLAKEGPLPTEQALQERRQQRNECGVQLQEGASHWDRLYSLMEETDTLSDQLRHEADRVAHHSTLQEQQASIQQQLQQLQQTKTYWETQHANLKQEWQEHWQSIGVQGQSPQQMRAWVQSFEEALQQENQWKQLQQVQAKRHQQLTQAHQDLKAWFGQHVSPWPSDNTSFESIWKHCQHWLETQEANQQKRHELQLQVDLLQARIDGIAAESDAFQKQTQHVLQQLLPDAASLPAEQGVLQLQAAFHEAQRLQQEEAHLKEQQTTLESEKLSLQQKEQQARYVLKQLCEQAHTEQMDQLETVAMASEQKRHWEDQCQQLQTRLLDLSAGKTLDVFQKDAEQWDYDQLPIEQTRCEQELSELQERLSGIEQKIGEHKALMGLATGESKAALLAEEAQSHAAQIQKDAGRYLELQLAYAVLQQQVEQYRQKHQAPLLKQASQWFHDFTLGQFQKIESEINEQEQWLLCGIRASGERVFVEGMSDGTRDQLYLSLRLATLMHYFEQHPVFPLIVDDILVHFDDARAQAVLQALAKLAQTTQVLFFTHHQHLVDLATQVLSPKQLHVQELQPQSTNSSTSSLQDATTSL